MKIESDNKMYCAKCRTRLVASQNELVGLYRCTSGHLVCENCTKDAKGICAVCGVSKLCFTPLNSMFPVTKFPTSNQNQNETLYSPNENGANIYPIKTRETPIINRNQFKQCKSVQTNYPRNVGGGSIIDSISKNIQTEILNCATEIVRLCQTRIETNTEGPNLEPVPPPRGSSYNSNFAQCNPETIVPPVANFQHPNLQIPKTPYYPINGNQPVPTIPYTPELNALIVENQRLQGANTDLLQALNNVNHESTESTQTISSTSSNMSGQQEQKCPIKKRQQCPHCRSNYAKEVTKSYINAEESCKNKVREVPKNPYTEQYEKLLLKNRRLKCRNKKLIAALNNSNQSNWTSLMTTSPSIQSPQLPQQSTNKKQSHTILHNHMMDRSKDLYKKKNESTKTYTVCKCVRKHSSDIPSIEIPMSTDVRKPYRAKNCTKNKQDNMQEVPACNQVNSSDTSNSECTETFYQLKNKIPSCHVKGTGKNKREHRTHRQQACSGGLRKKRYKHSDARLHKLLSALHESSYRSKSIKLARPSELQSTPTNNDIDLHKTRAICRKIYRKSKKLQPNADDESSDSSHPLRETYTKKEMAKMASQVARACYTQNNLSFKVMGRKLLTDPNPKAQFDIMEYPSKSISSLELLASQRVHHKVVNATTEVLPLHPFPCSEGDCKLHVFCADFTKHVHNDHNYLHTERILPRTYHNFFINLSEALSATPRSHYLYLIENKIKNLGTLVFQDVLPLLIMTSRLRLSDMIDYEREICCKEDIDFLLVWMCGLEPESQPLGVTLAIWKPAVQLSKCHIVYSGTIFKAAHNATTLNVYKSGKCILLTPQQQRALLVKGEFLQMQVFVH